MSLTDEQIQEILEFYSYFVVIRSSHSWGCLIYKHINDARYSEGLWQRDLDDIRSLHKKLKEQCLCTRITEKYGRQEEYKIAFLCSAHLIKLDPINISIMEEEYDFY